MKDDFSVLIQNRTEFEKGNPATVFLSLPATKEELHEAMKALNITADNPQDFFLNGYSTADNRRIEIPSDWIRDGSLDKINFLASRLEEMTPEQLERLDAVMHSDFKPESLDRLIDHTYNTDFYSYIPGILSYKELGDYFLNDSGKVVLVYKCGQEKLNNLYYQVKEQRRCSTWRRTKNLTLRNSSSRSWICTMPGEPRTHNWNVNMA